MSIRTLHEQDITGPNRDRGKLTSFAIKGDLQVRIIEDTELEQQALVVTLPEEVARKIAYDLVKNFESDDRIQALGSPKTRIKE